jgi:hypothetical protein
MAFPVPVTAESVMSAVASTEADFALTLATSTLYEFVSSTACWIKQGAAYLITCVAKADLVDTDYLTITIDGNPRTFAFDTEGDGVLSTQVQVDVSTDTTDAEVAARLRTAILAQFTSSALTVTDNLDGTLTVVMLGAQVAMSESVANAGFLAAASTALAATAGTGSHYTPANLPRYIDGKHGQTLSVIRHSADGNASLTRLRVVR